MWFYKMYIYLNFYRHWNVQYWCISASKRTNTYAFSVFKCTKLMYRQHLKINPYEYWNHDINCIFLFFLVVISITLFSIASLNCSLIYLIWNYNISFCCVISAARSFPIKRRTLRTVKQDLTLNLEINNIWNRLTFTCHVFHGPQKNVFSDMLWLTIEL